MILAFEYHHGGLCIFPTLLQLASQMIQDLFSAPNDHLLPQGFGSPDIEVGMEQRSSIVLELLKSIVPVRTALPKLSPSAETVLQTCARLQAKGELADLGETVFLGESKLQLYSAHVLYQALDLYLEAKVQGVGGADSLSHDPTTLKHSLRAELGKWVSEYNTRVRQAYSIYNLVCAWSQLVSVSFTSCRAAMFSGSRGPEKFQDMLEVLYAALRTAARYPNMPAHITVRLISTADILVNAIREYDFFDLTVEWRRILSSIMSIFQRCVSGSHPTSVEARDADMDDAGFTFPVDSPELRRSLYAILSSVLNAVRDSVCSKDMRSAPVHILEDVGKLRPSLHVCLPLITCFFFCLLKTLFSCMKGRAH